MRNGCDRPGRCVHVRCHCLVRRRLQGNATDRGGGREVVTGQQVLLLIVVLAVCWRTVQAEVVFHRRDHRDQGRHRQQLSERFKENDINNHDEAVNYLLKYGYLENCHRATRTKRHLPSLLLTNVTEKLEVCTDAMIADALKKLQQKFELSPSGRLDNETRILISRRRCGNSDVSEPPPTRNRRSVDREREPTSTGSESAGRDRAPDGSSKESRDLLRHLLIDSRKVGGRRKRSPETAETTGLPEIHETTEGVRERDEYSSIPIDSAMMMTTTTVMMTITEAPTTRRQGLNALATQPDYDAGSSRRRRQQMLQEIVERRMREEMEIQPQRNMTDEEMTMLIQMRQANRAQRLHRRRRKRTISVESMGDVSEGSSGDKVKFQKDENSPVRWRLLDDGISGKIPLADQRAILELSFRMWSEVIPLKFHEAIDHEEDINNVDVIIAFAKQIHMNCLKPFDGVGGELAHSWTGGDIHFDEDENYKRVDPTGTGINLLKVAVHEVGHVLGLLHNDKMHSIMYPIYTNPDMYDEFELSWDDRKAVQKIYGVCKGAFDVVFDWLRKAPSTAGGSETERRSRYIFNTYFFRNNRYWMYENRYNRTRFGDPLHIGRGWTGIEGTVDAYTQVITSTGQDYRIDTYFFVGDSYYKYNDETDQIETGYPRKIAEDFGPKSDEHGSIPGNLDAVLFDNRDSLLYFFKDEWVWIYDPKEIGRNACCEGKRLFSDLFPTELPPPSTPPASSSSPLPSSASPSPPSVQMAVAADESEQLTGHLDTVFYSYHFHTMFFFSGEVVYENAAYNEKTPRVNRLRRLGHWYHIWYDICDVE